MSRFEQSTTQAELKSKVMRRMPQLSFGKVTYVREQRLKLTNSNEKPVFPILCQAGCADREEKRCSLYEQSM